MAASTVQLVSPASITAQWILDNTAISFTETRDGPYEIGLSVNTGGVGLAWDLTKTSIGGTENIPQFTAGYSCDPEPGDSGFGGAGSKSPL